MRFTWVDVFCDRPFAGNPLAVFPDGDGLDAGDMQRIAAELGLSETVFVTSAGRALRIFTPRAELPLAGHPVIGASLELARLGRIPAEGVTRFETGAGRIEVELAGGRATMTQAPPERGEKLERAEIARMLGLEAEAVIGEPAVCSTGVRQAFAQVADRDILGRVRPDLERIATLAPLVGLGAWCEDGDGLLRQRFFGPQVGVPEDPATGSAAGALCALRVFEGGSPGAVTVRQGDEIGRPSAIDVEVGGEPGAPSVVRVGGRAAPIAEGDFFAVQSPPAT